MRFSAIKNHAESTGLRFWQVSLLWQRNIKKALQPFDMTHTQFVILSVIEELSEQGKAVIQKSIADFSMIDVMTVSSAVRLLEKKSLVSRAISESDTRAHAIVTTGKGKKLLAKAVRAVDDVDRMFFRSVGAGSALHQALSDLLAQNLEE
ncbi:MAG: MarR family transcriptional regulator [Treponemataceae bacterium]|nr:MarR family transcriptional regulator [Treponemataceae bacterium]